MPDRIETGTFLVAAAATGGDVALTGARPDTLGAVLDKLAEAGVAPTIEGSTIRIKRNGRLKSVSMRTAPYPGFPTDMQAQLMALMTVADDAAMIRNDIRESHDACAGAEAPGCGDRVEGNTAIVRGTQS